MKRLIRWLYRKYCVVDNVEVDKVFLDGLSRDFGRELSEQEDGDTVAACKQFVSSTALDYLINSKLKPYVEILLTRAESQPQKDFAIYAINILLEIERDIRAYAVKNDVDNTPYDPNDPL